MGNASAKAVDVKVAEAPAPANTEKKLKPCCACPETKRARDACIIENGEENCGPLIEEHKACMRKMGFNI
ncbi:hypothetical protein PYW07_004949 [Mythimna separata]|uniref:Cytochrome c oxidase copper chaperone n=1 Tax=Mythimna separata TaxID=271217 RepID=A0AAD7YED1_MYTSE|nr:hypothetical protein PYW07_004949 [Mythimna separata]